MSFINKWLRQDIKNIQAYKVAKSDNMLKMDAMESPFAIHTEIMDEYVAAIKKININRYPETSANDVKQTLRELMDIPDKLDLLLGNGSDEIIQILTLACNKDASIVSFEPSFVMYKMLAKFAGLKYHSIDLDKEFEIDIEKTLAVITKIKPQIIFIAYPNNPTGNDFNKDYIKKIATITDALVVIDEAYYAYCENSFLEELENFENMVLIRTISKIGFAGLRLGLLIGAKETIKQFNKLRLPYNISAINQASANILLKQKDIIKKNARIIINQREYMRKQLGLIQAIKVYPSSANFLLIETTQAQELFAFLQENLILIKDFSHTKSMLNYLRITISKEEDNNKLLKYIKQFYG